MSNDWRDEGTCRDGTHSPELWFPPGDPRQGITAAARAQTEDAKAICRECPVVAICADWALNARPRITDGIFGALDYVIREGQMIAHWYFDTWAQAICRANRLAYRMRGTP